MKSENGESPTSQDMAEDENYADSATDGLLGSAKSHYSWNQKEYWLARKSALRFHIIVFGLYLVTIIGLSVEIGRLSNKLHATTLYSPANEAVEYDIREWKSGTDMGGIYMQRPNPESEKAWSDLLKPMNIRLSRQDIEAFGRENVAAEMSDGSGYIGTLNVFHELHCVRWLYKYVYQDHFFPGADDALRDHNRLHSHHCLNNLMKSAKCHGDVGMVIYSWQDDSLKPGANGTAHKCVNWGKLYDWSLDRTVNIYKPGLLVHPTLGTVYPNGDPNGDHEHD